jgi:hypothetical protein
MPQQSPSTPQKATAWVFAGVFRSEAKRFLDLAREASSRFDEEWSRLLHEHGEERAPYHFPHRLSDDADLFANAATIFGAMTVEAFLNYYGVRHLGEAFYRRNCERLQVTQKVSVLIALRTGVRLHEGSEILGVARRLCEIRNRLVHPKTREWKTSQRLPPPVPGGLAAAEAAIRDMERFFELFLEVDPEARELAESV